MNSSLPNCLFALALLSLFASNGAPAATDATQDTSLPAASAQIDAGVADMMEQARQAFVNGDLDRAVALYTRIVELGEHSECAAALEFLGVTRQRKGQLAHAKAIFARYLEAYPDGEGRTRVQQRLAVITTPPALSKAPAGEQRARREWEMYGSHSSYYRQNQYSIDEAASVTNLSVWQSNMDFILRHRGERFDFLNRATVGYLADLADNGRDRSELIVTNAYFDVTDSQGGKHARLGRQSRSSGGVYGRFDGAHVAADWQGTTFNFVAGTAVQRTYSTVQSDRLMYGLSADLGQIAEDWDFTVFANNHTVDGVADRRGVGGEFRYSDQTRRLYGLVDYDMLYATVNATLLSATWTTAKQLHLHGSMNFRRSPILSTSNAIIGQGVESISELSAGLTEEELRALAEDNTATSSTASLGLSLPLSERFQFSADLNANRLKTAVNFAALSGSRPATDTLAVNTQLVATSWLRPADAWIVGLRVASSDTYNTATVSLNTRIPVSRHLRINPLLRLVYRDNTVSDARDWIVAPALRGSLRWSRHSVIEAELRSEVSERTAINGVSQRASYYVSLGYRSSFGR